MKAILVTGGTGVLGRRVVEELLKRGASPRVLSRKARPQAAVPILQGNLLDGSGLSQALAGVESVIHCASNPARPQEDLSSTRNLIEAAKQAGVGHLVLISIVGIDRMRWMPYYRVKLEQERLVMEGGIPYTILRAAQFFEFVAFLLASLGRGRVQWLPGGILLQPVDTGTVAARLAEAALADPAGRLPDLVGPKPQSLENLGREWMAATGNHKPVWVVPLPGFIARAWRPIGGLGAQQQGPSWADWLAAHAKEPNPYGGGG